MHNYPHSYRTKYTSNDIKPLLTISSIILIHDILLSFVFCLSFTYEYSKTMSLSKPARRAVTAIHAWSIEAVQLLLACIAVDNVVTAIRAAACVAVDNQAGDPAFPGLGHPSTGGISITVRCLNTRAFRTCVTMAANVLAIYAVDMIEGLITLKKFTHPYQWRCFVLTRHVLFSSNKRSSTNSERRWRKRKPALRINIPEAIGKVRVSPQFSDRQAFSVSNPWTATFSPLRPMDAEERTPVEYSSLDMKEQHRYPQLERPLLTVPFHSRLGRTDSFVRSWIIREERMRRRIEPRGKDSTGLAYIDLAASEHELQLAEKREFLEEISPMEDDSDRLCPDISLHPQENRRSRIGQEEFDRRREDWIARRAGTSF